MKRTSTLCAVAFAAAIVFVTDGARAVLGVFADEPADAVPTEAAADAGAVGVSVAAPAVAQAPTHPRLVVLGVDGYDPDILADVVERFPERTENLRWLIEQGGLHELGTSQPPQSPVAWSNFITGLDPGGHGIFDFIHRDPVSRGPAPATTVTSPTRFFGLLGGAVESNRTGESFWRILADHGVPADLWRMPINFPVEASNGVSFPGMMTPAIDSAYGEASLFTTDASARTRTDYDKVETITERRGAFETALLGPVVGKDADGKDIRTTVPMTIHLDRTASADGAVAIELAHHVLVLETGDWSDFVEVDFAGLAGIVRFHLASIEPHLTIYASPINIDPRSPAMDVSQPASASAHLADEIGTYYTQGMAEDVNALKNELITDAQFLQQSDLVYRERREMMKAAFDRYLAKEEGGLLFFYYSTVDLMCHMLWRHSDPDHPMFDAAMAEDDISWWSGRDGSTWRDVVHDIYLRIEPVVGEIREHMDAGGEDWTLMLISDHGFATYSRKFSINTWLYENGYLVLTEGREKEPAGARVPIADRVEIYRPDVVDWSRTRAYSVGFNGLYLNLAGREGHGAHGARGPDGVAMTDAERRALLDELKAKLEAVVDPQTGRNVVKRADVAEDFYANAGRLADAPDILVGFDVGYGNSDESAIGRVTHDVLQDNTGGTFNGSHLMCPDVVGGILLSSKPVRAGSHRLQDVTVEMLAHYGIEPTSEMKGHRVLED